MSRLQYVHDLVDGFRPTDQRGVESRASTVNFLRSANDAVVFDRSAGDEHVTASAVVMSGAGVLLHKHKIGQMWLGPGGHIDDDESPLDAVRRETFEETGVIARHLDPPYLLRVDVHETKNQHVHHDLCFLLTSGADAVRPGEGESPEVGWFGFDDAVDLCEATFAIVIRQAVERLEPQWISTT